MRIATQRLFSDLENAENYILIVDKDGTYRECKPRCLTNFKNYIVVGYLEYNDYFLSYYLFATENTADYRVSVLRKNEIGKAIVSKYGGVGETEEMPNDFIEKQALLRAKDIKFSFKGAK